VNKIIKIKVIMWKEFIDLLRDYKTIAATVLLPLMILPVLGFISFVLARERPPIVIIVDEDKSTGYLGNETISSRYIAYLFAYFINASRKAMSFISSSIDEALHSYPYFDVILVIRKGFIRNITSFEKVAYILKIQRVGSARANEAALIVEWAKNWVSGIIATKKINIIAYKANITINPESIRSPIDLEKVQYVTPTGEKRTLLDELKAQTARLLMFALFFIAPPIVTFISDSIIGERERKTIEILLTAPISKTELLLGKVFATTILGMIAAIADIMGLLIYFYLLYTSYGLLPIIIDLSLLAIHSLMVFITSLLTAALILPFIVRTKTIRSAQIVSSAVISIATIVFFMALFVEIPSLPLIIRIPLYLIPFTHCALVIYSYMYDYALGLVVHLTIAVLSSLTLIIIAYKVFDEERILIGPTT